MPYKTLPPVFTAPPGSSRLWRYLDFAKYVSLLETKSLHFARSDLLGDSFEGSTPSVDREAFRATLDALAPGDAPNREDAIAKGTESHSTARKLMTNNTYINCWHMSEHEQAAMWRIYAENGLAIRTTFDRFTSSLDYPEPIYAGLVRYINYSSDSVGNGGMFGNFMHKRLSFESEREVRAVLWHGDKESWFELEGHPAGVYVPVDPELLVEHVFVTPKAPSWFLDLVEAVSQRYGLAAPVQQ
jgi:hypothetical protein